MYVWAIVTPWVKHYLDVIMTTMASQITSLTVVYWTVYSDADQRKHQSSASLAFVWEITETGEFPAQRASYAENVSIWWRHHDMFMQIPWVISIYHWMVSCYLQYGIRTCRWKAGTSKANRNIACQDAIIILSIQVIMTGSCLSFPCWTHLRVSWMSIKFCYCTHYWLQRIVMTVVIITCIKSSAP